MSEDDDPTLLQGSADPATGGAADPARRIVPGDRIGRHVVERRLAAGGMGVVYLARDPDLDRPVAIKLLRPELATSRSRLLREGQAVAKLSHPNVVTVYDVGALGDDLYIAMEYVPGRTLGSWLRRAERPWREVLARFRAAGRGLAAAHRAGLIHRDFKPDNVLLGDDGRVVVSDFGLARSDGPRAGGAGAGDLDLTRTQGLLGTPAYMSPEQFAERPLDGRSDQFSYCVSLWQGLFGRRPFDVGGDDTTAVEDLIRAVTCGDLRDPADRRGVPVRIVRTLRRGLAADPAARFPTMEALLEALRPPDRRPVVFAAVGIGAVAVLAAAASRGGATAPGVADCGEPARRPAALWNDAARAAYLAAGDPAHAAEDAAWFDEIARRWSATARAICEAGERAPPRAGACLDDALAALEGAIGRDTRAYWPALRDPRACLDARPLAIRELRSQLGSIDPSGAIAPDGGAAFASDELYAYFGPDGATARAALLAGVTRVHAWTPDGRHLLARAGDATVRIDMAEGERTTLPWPADLLALTPDAGIAARRDGDAVVFLGAGGVELARVPAPPDVTAVAIEPGGRRGAIAANDEDDAWVLITVDLRTGEHRTNPLRIHGEAGGTMAMTWAGPGAIAIGGGQSHHDDEALWRVELDDTGAITGPPVVLIPPRDRTIMDLLDVRDGRALIVMVDVPVRVYRVRGGAREVVPGLVEGMLLSSEAATRRVLAVHEGRAIVFDDEGSVIADAPDRGMPVLQGGALWFAREEGGEVVLDPAGGSGPARRIRGKLPGALDRVRCGAAGQCWVSWRDGELRHAAIEDDALGPAFTVPERERDLSLAPDRRRAAVVADRDLIVFDVAAARSQVLHRVAEGCRVDDPVWSPGGDTVFFGVRCEGGWEIQAIAAAGGAPRRIETVTGYLIGLEPLGDDEVVYATVDYQSRLVLVDDLPTATSAE